MNIAQFDFIYAIILSMFVIEEGVRTKHPIPNSRTETDRAARMVIGGLGSGGEAVGVVLVVAALLQ